VKWSGVCGVCGVCGCWYLGGVVYGLCSGTFLGFVWLWLSFYVAWGLRWIGWCCLCFWVVCFGIWGVGLEFRVWGVVGQNSGVRGG